MSEQSLKKKSTNFYIQYPHGQIQIFFVIKFKKKKNLKKVKIYNVHQ